MGRKSYMVQSVPDPSDTPRWIQTWTYSGALSSLPFGRSLTFLSFFKSSVISLFLFQQLSEFQSLRTKAGAPRRKKIVTIWHLLSPSPIDRKQGLICTQISQPIRQPLVFRVGPGATRGYSLDMWGWLNVSLSESDVEQFESFLTLSSSNSMGFCRACMYISCPLHPKRGHRPAAHQFLLLLDFSNSLGSAWAVALGCDPTVLAFSKVCECDTYSKYNYDGRVSWACIWTWFKTNHRIFQKDLSFSGTFLALLISTI